MALTAPYRQHNYMGEYANDGACLTFIQAQYWDSAGNGTGNPQEGMFYYNTTSDVFRLYANGSWTSLSTGAPTLSNVLGAGDTVQSGEEIAVASGGHINVASGGHIDIAAGGDLTIADAPSANTDAVNKLYVDSLVALGVHWLAPVLVRNMFSDADMGGSPPLGPTTGNAYVVNNWGVGYTNGDIYEYTGSGWQLIQAGTGNPDYEPIDGTRVICAVPPAPSGSFQSNPRHIATYNATTNAWTFYTPNDGDASIVIGDSSLYENRGYIYENVTPGWMQFAGASLYTAGDGIDIVSNVISLDLAAGGGLKIASTELAVEPSDFAGTGLEDDGSDNLRIAAAAAGNGLSGGGGSALAVGAGNGISVAADSVAVAAANVATKGGVRVDSDGVYTCRIAAGNPIVGAVTGDLGQLYVDSSTGIAYINIDPTDNNTTGWVPV